MKTVEEKERRNNARIFLEAALREAVIFVNGDKLQLSGKDISTRINEGIGKLIAAGVLQAQLHRHSHQRGHNP